MNHSTVFQGQEEISQTISNWRAAAMDKAVRAQDTRTAHLLRAVRSRAPHMAMMLLGCRRSQLVKFLKESCEAKSVLPGNCYWSNHAKAPVEYYFDWFEATWQEQKIEVALLPGVRNDAAICMAETEEVLLAFNAAASEYAEKPIQRALRYSDGWETSPDLEEELGRVTWDDLVLSVETLHGLRQAIEGFVKNRKAFETLGFPYRRGVLLCGAPGTGKTMICKAAASALPELPFLYVRDFRGPAGHDAIEDIFVRARQLTPCLLVFEDIDGLLHCGNRTQFLNELDGFENNEGLLVIASSNHPGRIDEALLKRPSRFDRVFHIGLPAQNERREYCRRLLHSLSVSIQSTPEFDREQLADTMSAKTDGFTPAYLKEAFTGAALQCAQNGEMILDEQFGAAVLSQIDELRAHLKQMKNPDILGEMKSGDDAIGLVRR